MLPKSTAYILAVFAVLIVAGAQLIIKGRFEVLGLGQRQGYGIYESAKLSMGDPYLWIAGFMMLAGAISWYAALSRLPLSLLVPAGATIAPLVAIGAHLGLGESLSWSQSSAILVIAIGVFWLGLTRT
jgi:drug/metabolite transporter (DMT)-like permease